MEWLTDFPDWKDSGKRVRLLMDDGKELVGELFAEDEFFTGEDEIPIFVVILEDGSKISFAEAKAWKFENACRS